MNPQKFLETFPIISISNSKFKELLSSKLGAFQRDNVEEAMWEFLERHENDLI